MCGIVGYYGPNDVKTVLMNGLSKLEYRGYDSSGMAIIEAGKCHVFRAEGKLTNLQEKLKNVSLKGSLGIAHTRWATHGSPCEKNAHPHKTGAVSIVHNGIIENFNEIKEALGIQQLSSETDSEVIGHLLTQKTSKGLSLLDATLEVLKELKGAYAVLAINENDPEEWVGFKNGPPLIVGLLDNELIVASDIQAIAPYTKKIIYLNDGEIIYAKKNKFKIFNSLGELLHKDHHKLKWNENQLDKMGYEHYMLKEIFEQPRIVASRYKFHIEENQVQLKNVGFGVSLDNRKFLDYKKDLKITEKVFKEVEEVIIVACGSSYYTGLWGQWFIEHLSRIPVRVEMASELIYKNPILQKKTLAILISQSGETADTLAALRMLKSRGIQTLSICNTVNSSIDQESDGHLYMEAGLEISVASTKALSATLSLLNLVAVFMSKCKKLCFPDQEKELIQSFLKASYLMDQVLASKNVFRSIAEDLKNCKGFLFVGRGPSCPMAFEGALKLKELTYLSAQAYPAGEMKHGPLALVDSDMAVVVLVPRDGLYKKTLNNLAEIRARGGRVVAIGSVGDKEVEKMAYRFVGLPFADFFINPLLQVIPMQLLAYYMARALNRDVDRPRNLAKSVTVE